MLVKLAVIRILPVALLALAWRRVSAAQRHLIWCAALGAILLLPLTRSVVPRWTVPLGQVAIAFPLANASDAGPKEAVTFVEAAGPELPVAAARWQWPDWLNGRLLAAGLWAAGAAGLLALRLLGSVRLWRLRATSRPLESERVCALAAEILAECGIRRRVELRVAPAGWVPLTWGTWRPVLMLPSEALGWSEAQLAVALRHEAGHIARGDHFTGCLAHLACAFYWPNPLVWLAARRMRTAQEQATDDLVLRSGTAADEYAAQLFEVARSLAVRHGMAQGAVAMASPSTLETRLLAIVDERRDRRPLTRSALAGGLLAISLVLGLATAAQLRAEEKKSVAAGAEKKQGGQAKSAQVMILTKFIELRADADLRDPELAWLKSNDALGSLQTKVLDASAEEALIAKLEKAEAMKVISRPTVVAADGMRAMVSVGAEFPYAKDWEKVGAGWKGKTFTTLNRGLSLEVTPKIEPKGRVLLDLTRSVVELVGYVDKDSAKVQPVERGEGESVHLLANPPAGMPPEGRNIPVISTRKVTVRIAIASGQTVIFANLPETEGSKDFPPAKARSRILVFVTAKVIPPAGEHR